MTDDLSSYFNTHYMIILLQRRWLLFPSKASRIGAAFRGKHRDGDSAPSFTRGLPLFKTLNSPGFWRRVYIRKSGIPRFSPMTLMNSYNVISPRQQSVISWMQFGRLLSYCEMNIWLFFWGKAVKILQGDYNGIWSSRNHMRSLQWNRTRYIEFYVLHLRWILR